MPNRVSEGDRSGGRWGENRKILPDLCQHPREGIRPINTTVQSAFFGWYIRVKQKSNLDLEHLTGAGHIHNPDRTNLFQMNFRFISEIILLPAFHCCVMHRNKATKCLPVRPSVGHTFGWSVRRYFLFFSGQERLMPVKRPSKSDNVT